MGDYSGDDDDLYAVGREEEWNYKDELLASCSYLGKKVEGNKYEKGIDCIESLKEIQQFLYRDDPVGEMDQPSRFDSNGRPISKRPWELHRSLAEWNILSNHILPLLACHGDDPEVLYESMVVMLLMTSLPPAPKHLLDDEKETKLMKQRVYGAALVPVFDGLCMMKEQFAASKSVLLTIMKWLSEPLLHEGEDRTEAEATVLELALNLIRNLLLHECPVDSGVKLPEISRRDLGQAQDKLLQTFAEVGVLEMLIILAQRIEDEENRTWNLLLLDIFTLIFAKEDPAEMLGSAAVVSGAWQSSARRQELLKKLPDPAASAIRRQQRGRRHQRFAGLFQTTASNGIRLLSASAASDPTVPVNNSKRRGVGFKKRPLLEPGGLSVADRSGVLQTLDKCASLFVEVGFNALFGTVAFDYAMESHAIVKSDDWNYSSLAAWFLRYHRLHEQARIAALPPKPRPEKEAEGKKEETEQEKGAETQDAQEKEAEEQKEGRQTEEEEGASGERGTGAESGAAAAAAAEEEEAAAAAGGDGTQEVLAEVALRLGRGQREEEAEREATREAEGGGREEARGEEAEQRAAAGGEEEAGERVGVEEEGEAGEVGAVLAALCEQVAAAAEAEHEPPQPQHAADAAGGGGGEEGEGGREGGEGEEARTPPPEPVDPYDYDAGQVSSLMDLGSLKWTLEKTLRLVRPETGGDKPQWAQLPPLVGLLREMLLALSALYHSSSRRNKDVASVILRNLVFEWDCGDIFLTLLREYRPDRNTRAYLADLCSLVHVSLRLIKAFSQENQNLIRLKKRRKKIRRSRHAVGKKEGDGEWLGGSGEDEEQFEESEEYDEVVFHFETFQRRFCHPQVVTAYAYLLSWYRSNRAETNHEAVKMLNLVAHSCRMLPMLFQLSIFRVFNLILADRTLDGKPEHKEMVDFVRWVIRNFFKLAMESPCMFVELVAWTKSQRDASLIMRGFKPEERAGKADKAATEEEAVYQLGRQAGKWSAEEDQLLQEALLQYGGKANAPQIIATMLEGKSAQQVAARLNKLGLGGAAWEEEDEDEDEEADAESAPDVYTCARRLRNSRPAALDWVLEQLRAACLERDVVLTADRGTRSLPAAFYEVEAFAMVPVAGEEWEHVIDGGTMRLFRALGLSCPRLVEGHAYWTVGAPLLQDTAALDKKLSDLELAQSVPITDPIPPPPPRLRPAETPGREVGGEEEKEGPESGQATRVKGRRVRRTGGESEESDGGDYGGYELKAGEDSDAEQPPADQGPTQEEEEEEAQVLRKTKRALMGGDSDEEAAREERQEAAGKEASSEITTGPTATKRARLRLIQDSDSE